MLAHVEDVKGREGGREGGGDEATDGTDGRPAGGKGGNFYEECPLLLLTD